MTKYYSYIKPFAFNDYNFKGAYVFSGKYNSFLLSNSGMSIVFSNDVVENIKNHQLSDNLLEKLIQRDFVSSNTFKRELVQESQILPTFFIIDFITKCNLNCRYCLRHFENEGRIISKKSLTDICNYIISYYKAHKLKSITIQPWGGEPLLALDLIIYSKNLFKSAGVNATYIIQTNGLLLDEKTLNTLIENNIDFGISIDGNKTVTDMQRVDYLDNGIFDRLKNVFEMLKKRNKSTGLISVNTQWSMPYIEDSMRTFIEELGINSFKFNIAHPNVADYDKSMIITGEKVTEFCNSVFDAFIGNIRRGNKCYESNICQVVSNLLDRRNNDICHSNGCQGGKVLVSFGYDGKIYPCELIGNEDNCFGSIYDNKDLVDIIKENANNIYFYPRESVVCKQCPYKSFCKGGCYACAKSFGCKKGEVDMLGCLTNHVYYKRVIDLILNEPDLVQEIARGGLKIK